MKVIAVKSLENGRLEIYSYGQYLGDKVPDITPFRDIGRKNPCILLDNGKYVWGFQCWWGDPEEFRKEYLIQEEVVSEITNDIQPIKEI